MPSDIRYVSAGPRERPFEPTQNQRDQVEFLVANEHPLYEICLLIENPTTGVPISGPMLKDVFRREIARGRIKMISAVEREMYRMALHPDMTPVKLRAAERILRSKGGWRETVAVDHQMSQNMIEGAKDILQSKIDRFANRAEPAGIPEKPNGSGS